MSLLKTCLQVVSPHLYFFIMDGGEKRTTELLTCCWTACPPQWDTQTDRDRPVAVLQRCTCSISISTSSVTVHFSAHVTGSISQKPTVNPSPFPAGTYHVMSCHVRGWTEVWAPNSGFISVNTGALYGLGCVCVFEGFSKASTRVSGQVSVRVLL